MEAQRACPFRDINFYDTNNWLDNSHIFFQLPFDVVKNIFSENPLALSTLRLTCKNFTRIIDLDKKFTLYRLFVDCLSLQSWRFPQERAEAIAAASIHLPDQNAIDQLIQHAFALNESSICNLDCKTLLALKKLILRNVFPTLAAICPEGLIKLAVSYGFTKSDALVQIAFCIRATNFKKSFEMVNDLDTKEKIKAFTILTHKSNKDFIKITEYTPISNKYNLSFGLCDYPLDDFYDFPFIPIGLTIEEYLQIINKFIFPILTDDESVLSTLCQTLVRCFKDPSAPESINFARHFARSSIAITPPTDNLQKMPITDVDLLSMFKPVAGFTGTPWLTEPTYPYQLADPEHTYLAVSPLHDIGKKI
jgi:hypothetical protein